MGWDKKAKRYFNKPENEEWGKNYHEQSFHRMIMLEQDDFLIFLCSGGNLVIFVFTKLSSFDQEANVLSLR